MWLWGSDLLILAKKQPILAKCLHIFLITQLVHKIHPMRVPKQLEWVNNYRNLKIWIRGVPFSLF